MTPGLRNSLPTLRDRPSLFFGHEPSFDEVAAFLLGADLAYDGLLLLGFREWLLVRTDGPPNLTWEGIVRHSICPGGVRPTTGDEQELVTETWDLLAEFLDERDKTGGMARIYERFIRWHDEKDFNSGWPIGSINERVGSLAQLPPDWVGPKVHEVHAIRRKPISSLTASECQLYVSLWLNLEIVVPRAVELLGTDESGDETAPDGRLLQSLLDLGAEWWNEHPNYLREFRRSLESVPLSEGQRQSSSAWLARLH